MSAQAPALEPAVASSAGDSWLHGRTVDLLLGSGLAYVVSIPLLVFAAQQWDVTDWPVAAAALLALAFNIPHYGATILRAYDQAEDRRRYAAFTVWMTLLAGAAVTWLPALLFAPGVLGRVPWPSTGVRRLVSTRRSEPPSPGRASCRMQSASSSGASRSIRPRTPGSDSASSWGRRGNGRRRGAPSTKHCCSGPGMSTP